MNQTPKIFNLAEVNALIPEIQGRLHKFLSKKESYARLHDEVFIHELLTHIEKDAGIEYDENHLDADRKNLDEEVSAMGQDILALIQMGCLVRDLENGLIEFRGQYQGELVYFLWESGQSQICFYRKMEDPPRQKRSLV